MCTTWPEDGAKSMHLQQNFLGVSCVVIQCCQLHLQHSKLTGVVLHQINEKTTWRQQNEATESADVKPRNNSQRTWQQRLKAVLTEMTWCLCMLHVTMWVRDAAEVSQVICWFSFLLVENFIFCIQFAGHDLVSAFDPYFISSPIGLPTSLFSCLTSVKSD